MSLRKSCLKLSSPLPSPGLAGGRKNVVFDESETREEVFIADDWDRTPSEPSLKLSYSDLLELKAIQRSLPRANQLPDPYSGKPATNYLRKVPIHLLPLLPDTPSPSPSPTPFLHNGRDITSPPAQQEERTGWASDVQPVTSVSVTRRPEAPSSASYYPPHLAHLRSMKKEEGKKMPFAILPLLDNACPSLPPPIVAPAPQPATSSTEPPPFFLLPPGRNRNAQEDQKNAYSLYPPSTSSSSSTPKPEEEKKKKSRNVMWVNGMEIDLDDDDEPEEPVQEVLVTDEETETETETETDIPSSSDSSAIHTETESSDDEECTPCSMKRLPRLSFSSQSSSSSYQSSLLDTPPPGFSSFCGEDTNRKEWASVFA